MPFLASSHATGNCEKKNGFIGTSLQAGSASKGNFDVIHSMCHPLPTR